GDGLCGRHLIASYPYTGTKNSNYEPNMLHRAGSPRCRSASSSSYHQSRSCGARSSRRNAAARCGAFNDALSYSVADRRLSPSRSAPEAYRASVVDAGPTRRSVGLNDRLVTLELAVKQLRHFIIFGQALSYPRCLRESVERDFRVTATVALWWRQPTSCEVYLQGRQHQRRHREGPIPLRPEPDGLAFVSGLPMA